MSESCGNCKMFHASKSVSGFNGECRINPPAKRGRRWPAVNSTEFCGKWKKAEAQSKCLAVRQGDEFYCATCAIRWGVNDWDAASICPKAT